MTPKTGRLEQLTSLRFFAAMAVLSSHLWPLAEEPNALRPIAQGLFHEGYAGVSFFFMLSGFLLAHTYRDRLRAGAVSRGKYLALRLARIGPLHWLLALPFVVLALWHNGADALPKIAVNLALLHSWVPDSAWYFSLIGPSWSLSDEAFFYICFAGLAFLPWRALLVLALVMLGADMAMAGWLTTHGRGASTAGDAMTLTEWLVYIVPLTRLLDFIIGMLLYRLPRLADLVPSRRWATVIEAAALAALLASLVGFYGAGMPDAWRMQIAYLPFIALLLWSFAGGGGVMAGWLADSKRLILLGDASFALYLVHLPLITGVFSVWEEMDNQPPVLLVAAGVTAVAVALSVAIYRWIEVPLLRITRRMIDRRFAR